MIHNKEEFIKKYLGDSVKELELTQINLDTSDLSIADILRNVNKLYPINTKLRNSIEDGVLAIGILCRTDTVIPYNGIFLIIAKGDIEVDIVSSKYIVLMISEENIRNADTIQNTIDRLTRYLATTYTDILQNLPEFYRKFVYDPEELEDDYQPIPY